MGGERTRTVSVRLSPAEHAVWVGAARAAGRGRLGSWVRDRVAVTLTAGSGVAGPTAGEATGMAAGVSVGEWAGLRAELGRVGNNLNQAVRVANSSGVNPARVAELTGAVEAVRTATAELLAAVRAATGVGPTGVPVVRSRSIADQLADADAAEAVERRVRAEVERRYQERIARARAASAERVAQIRRERAAAAGGSSA